MMNKIIIIVITFSIVIIFSNCVPAERPLSRRSPLNYEPQKAGAAITYIYDLTIDFELDSDKIECMNIIKMYKSNNIFFISSSYYNNSLNKFNIFDEKNETLNYNKNVITAISGISYNKTDDLFFIHCGSTGLKSSQRLLICDNNFVIKQNYYLGINDVFYNTYNNLNYLDKYNKLTIIKKNKSEESKLNEIIVNNQDLTADYVELSYNFFDTPPLYMHLVDDYALLCYNEYKTSSKEWWYESKLIVKNVFTGATLEEVDVNYLGMNIYYPKAIFYETPYIWFIAQNYDKEILQLIQIKVL